MTSQPTRVWAIVADGTPGGRVTEMRRTTEGTFAAVPYTINGTIARYTALIDGKYVDYPPDQVTE